MASVNRLLKEFKTWAGDPPPFAESSVERVNGSIYHWAVLIKPLAYSGESLRLEFIFPDEYPFIPPTTIKFVPPIWHPAVNPVTGHVSCFMTGGWRPSLNTWQIVNRIVKFIEDPDKVHVGDCEMIFNEKAQKEWFYDPDHFQNIATNWYLEQRSQNSCSLDAEGKKPMVQETTKQ